MVFGRKIRRCFNRIKGFFHNKRVARINKNFNKKCRAKLTNDNFSIICSNCMGGTIYHRLGKKMLSPTVNLWIGNRGFIKFVSNLEYYLKQELVFVESEYNYPVAEIGDKDKVKIYFNHAKTEEEAKDAWYRRRARVNFNNLYIIMFYESGMSAEEFKPFEKVKCNNKIVFSPYPGTDFADYIKVFKPQGDDWMSLRLMNTDKYGIRQYEKIFDFVAFLNKK